HRARASGGLRRGRAPRHRRRGPGWAAPRRVGSDREAARPPMTVAATAALVGAWLLAAALARAVGIWLAVGGAAVVLGAALLVVDRATLRPLLVPPPRAVVVGLAAAAGMVAVTWLLVPAVRSLPGGTAELVALRAGFASLDPRLAVAALLPIIA